MLFCLPPPMPFPFLPAIEMKTKSQRRDVFSLRFSDPCVVLAQRTAVLPEKEQKKSTFSNIFRVYFRACNVNIQYLQSKCPAEQCKYSIPNQNRCTSQMLFFNKKVFKHFGELIRWGTMDKYRQNVLHRNTITLICISTEHYVVTLYLSIPMKIRIKRPGRCFLIISVGFKSNSSLRVLGSMKQLSYLHQMSPFLLSAATSQALQLSCTCLICQG